ncbi:MAG: helix-turn-helix transcriptional regulator [Pseudomonadota bacterium]
MASLTEGERACLSLVARNMSSKEIALELGVSPHTIDQRLKKAMRTLGVANRRIAARLYSDTYGTDDVRELVHQSPDVAVDTLERPQSLASGHGDRIQTKERSPAGFDRQSETKDDKVRDTAAAIPAAPATETDRHDPLAAILGPIDRTGGRSFGERIVRMLAISVISALAFGAILSGLHSIGSLF